MMMAAAAAVALGAWAAMWTDPDTGYTWTYRINGDTAEIRTESYSAAISPSPTGAVTIPSTLGGKPVTSIGYEAFVNCSGLTSVTIPDGVTSIGLDAFYGCSGLTSVTIGNGVTSIGYSAFSGCSGLTSVHVTDLAKWCSISFGSYAANPLCYAHNLYLNGAKVTDLTIPNSVTSVGSCAFYGCSGLTSVTIPDGVTSIGDDAFWGCSGLTSVTIPDSVTSIGSSAFSGCSDSLFDTTTIPGVKLVDGWAVGNTGSLSCDLNLTGVRGIGGSAFSECSGLTSVTIPDGVTSIGSDAFYGCSGLTSVTIGNGVTSIGYRAFCGCGGLTSVTIGNGVTSIGYSAFSGCSGLTSVHVTDLAKWCSISFGSYAANPLCYAHNLYLNGAKVTDLTIPNSVTSVGSCAFYGCSGLTSVTIPDGVTSIGGDAFADCDNLTHVTLGRGVGSCNSHIGCAYCGYYNEQNLASMGMNAAQLSVDFTESVTSIGSYLLADMDNLVSVTIPNSVTNIGMHAFYGCTNLTSVTIPDSVRSIGISAFEECHVLAEVKLGSGVTEIESHAFRNCYALKNIVFPSRLKYIGFAAFAIEDYQWCGCACPSLSPPAADFGSGLTRVNLQDALECIGGQAFWGTTFWKNVPNGIVYLGNYLIGVNGECPDHVSVRTGCTLIADEAFEEENLTSVTIPDSVKFIGSSAFYGCERLTSVTIPDKVTRIEEHTFAYCDRLANVTIGRGVESIGYHAFEDCRSLMSLVIPGGVVSIDKNAFDDCDNLKSIVFQGSAPLVVDEDEGETEEVPAFNIDDEEDGMSADCTAYVAHGSSGWGVAIPGRWKGIRIAYSPGAVEGLPLAGTFDTAFAKAQTVAGALYDEHGGLAGTVQLKAGKMNAGGVVKVNGAVTLLSGKKVSSKVAMLQDGRATLVFKEPVGTLELAMSADGSFVCDGAHGTMGYGVVGGNWTRDDAAVFVYFGYDDSDDDSLPDGTLTALLPDDEDGEPIILKNGKWAFAKAASVKWAKPKKGVELADLPIYDAESGKGLIVDTSKDKTNLSGMKLTYTPKKGTFKGSFKVYELQGEGKKTRLKKYSVKVNGVVVDGCGFGEAICKKPALAWPVRVE